MSRRCLHALHICEDKLTVGDVFQVKLSQINSRSRTLFRTLRHFAFSSYNILNKPNNNLTKHCVRPG